MLTEATKQVHLKPNVTSQMKSKFLTLYWKKAWLYDAFALIIENSLNNSSQGGSLRVKFLIEIW